MRYYVFNNCGQKFTSFQINIKQLPEGEVLVSPELHRNTAMQT